MRDPKKTAEQFQESLNELFHDDPWFDSYLNPIIAALDEHDMLLAFALAEREAMRALLVEWLRNGRFWVAGTPELDDLVKRTIVATEGEVNARI